MRPLPFQFRVLLVVLGGAALLPFLLLVAEYAGLVAPGLELLVSALSVLVALVALLVFEPPQALSVRRWLRQLRRRLDSSVLSPPSPTPTRKA